MMISQTQIPFIDFSEQYKTIQADLKRAVQEVLDSGHYILGGKVKLLEDKIARISASKYAIGLASGSDALLISLMGLGIGPGDEVITSPFTFFATVGAISRVGAKPVFADIDLETFNIDPARILERITNKTKAIIPVHLFGLPADMTRILMIAREHGLSVIEDAAQSFGATHAGRMTGSIGDIGCYSFYPTKNLGGAGDGGMIVTSSDSLARRVRLIHQHGSKKKYFHDLVGLNSRLDEIQAAILLVKLNHIGQWNELRRHRAGRYTELLKELPVRTPRVPEGSKHIFHLYTILSDRRDALAAYLSERGIGTGIYYPVPIHLQVCYSELGYKKGSLPNAERAAGEVLSLPMFPELPLESVSRVSSTVREFIGGMP